MIKYIYNSNGDYVAYIYNGLYCFSKDNNYIGFMVGIFLYDYKGNYMGYLTSDDRIIRRKDENRPKVSPISKPLKPLQPLSPLKRFSMSTIGNGYIDVFRNIDADFNYEKLDKKYNKYLNSKLFACDGKYLGIVSLNKYSSDSIANQYGIFGSQYSSESIFNKYGIYGSQYSSLSPFNSFSSNSLILKDNNNNIIGRLSDNKYLGNNVINATEFFNWFKSKIN